MARAGEIAMALNIVIPKSVKPGFYFARKNFALGLLAHTLQSDQRWIFLLRIGNYRFGYRTRGDAKPEHATYYNAGLHFGKKKGLSGRG